jgi:hypothetical protein
MVKSFKRKSAPRVSRVTLREVFTSRGFQTRRHLVNTPSSSLSSPKKTPRTSHFPEDNDLTGNFSESVPNIGPLRMPASNVNIIIMFQHHILTVTFVESSNNYMQEWLCHRAEYLDHILAREAPPENPACLSCSMAEGTWKCTTCFGNPIYCQKCCADVHQRQPFHRVERWMGTYFAPAWLIEIGVKLHLGHGGLKCHSTGHSERVNTVNSIENIETDDDTDTEADAETDAEFTNLTFQAFPNIPNVTDNSCESVLVVVDSSGIHRLAVRWCQCSAAARPDCQLLDIGLYPATSKKPRTAFTFQVLDEFLIDNLECKTACQTFHSKLLRLTCSQFPHTVPVCCIP